MQSINKIPWVKNKYNSILRNLMVKLLFEENYSLNAQYILKKKSESLTFKDDEVTINNYHYKDVYFKKLFLRRNSSDLLVFRQVFIQLGYKTLFDIFKVNFKHDKSPVRIIDLGANIGLTTIYATTQFPLCEIIAIEPFAENFKLLSKNINALAVEKDKYKIVALNKAIWQSTGRLKIVNKAVDDWAIQVVDDQEGNIQSITMEEVLKYMPDIDILKIDIEGTEFAIINDTINCDWLLKVKVIGIEIHNHLGDHLSIIGKILSYGFVYCGSVGETTVFLKK